MRRRCRGFTLVELIIVVVIVALLAGLAYPAYVSFVERARHKEATSALQEVMQKQQKYRSDNGTYTSDLSNLPDVPSSSPTSEHGAYDLSAAACGGDISECVEVKAKPNGGSTDSATFTYNSRGVKEPVDKWE